MKRNFSKKVSVAALTPASRLSDRIRHARVRASLTKAELARRVGVCASAVVQWEHPQHTAPNTMNLARVAEITGVAFEWLATGRGPTRPTSGDETPAVDPAAMASTLFEERLLDLARKLPPHRHDALLDFLAAWLK